MSGGSSRLGAYRADSPAFSAATLGSGQFQKRILAADEH